MNDGPDLSPAPPPPDPRLLMLGNWWRRSRTIRAAPRYGEGLAWGAAGIGLLLLVWWVLTAGSGDSRLVDAYTLPSPRETFAAFPALWKRELSRSIVISLARVLGGFLLSAAIGVPLGVICGSYLRINAFIKPLVIFGRSIPVAALIPLTMVWFGLGEFNKVMFIFLATLAFVVFDTVNTVYSVPGRFIDTAYTLGARASRKKGTVIGALAGVAYGLLMMCGWYLLKESDGGALAIEFSSAAAWIRFGVGFVTGFVLWYPVSGHQILRKVILPLALPDIVNSLRLIFGLAFGYIMLAEVINAQTGIGALIINSQRRGYQEHVYLCLFVITLLAWAIDRSIIYMQRQLFPYIQHGDN